MLVVDASAVVELLLGREKGERVGALMAGEEGALHAPALLDVETAQAFRRLASSGQIRPARARASIEILQELPIDRHPSTPLLRRIWDLRENLTAYDAAYVSLAEALGCPLVTFDERLARAQGLRADVLVP